MFQQPNNFESVLQIIHRDHISLPKEEVRRNNEILEEVIKDIKAAFVNYPLFFGYFNRAFYGGSFYDGLKIGSPEEFDIDLLFKIPEIGQPVLEYTNEPGYLSLRFNAPGSLSEYFKQTMLDGNYLSTSKVLSWMESVITKIINNWYYYKPNYKLEKNVYKSGPAMTLIITGGRTRINIDLVPCFEFSSTYWPQTGYKPNPVPQKNTFFIVPKSPKNKQLAERYWRLSFQEQERELIRDKENLKVTLRLLKKLRDDLGHTAIASYYIKTIFLWEIERVKEDFWNGSLTNVFLHMFDLYIRYIEFGRIPYFWNTNNNLLNLSPETLTNMINRLRRIQKDILENYKTNPTIICKYLNLQK